MTTEYKGPDLKVTVVDDQVRDLFRKAPGATFVAIRNYMGRIFGHHRKTWLAATAVRLNVAGGASFDKASFYGGLFGKARSFRFEVLPVSKAVPAFPNLADIKGRVYTKSTAALGLETGGTWRPQGGQKFLAIPLAGARDSRGRRKKWYGSPAKARAHGHEFVVHRSPSGGLMLLEVVRKPIKRRGGKSVGGTKYKPAYQLVKQVTQKPVLRFIASWDADASYRQRALQEAKDEILRTLRA